MFRPIQRPSSGSTILDKISIDYIELLPSIVEPDDGL